MEELSKIIEMQRINNLHESSLSRARQSQRTRFSTVDVARTTTASIYKTAKESLTDDTNAGDAILDPRVLYRAKNSTATAANTAFDIIKLQAPGPPTLAHKKLSMYHTRLAQGQTKRLGVTQRINLNPLRSTAVGRERRQLMLGRPDACKKKKDAITLRSVISPGSNRGSTAAVKGDVKLSQTLMSHHSRKQTGLLKDSFPQVALLTNQGSLFTKAGAGTIGNHQSDFGGAFHRRAIMADTQRSYDPIMRPGPDILRASPHLFTQGMLAQKTNQINMVYGRGETYQSTPATVRNLGRSYMNTKMPVVSNWHNEFAQNPITTGGFSKAAAMDVPKTSAQPHRKVIQSMARQRHSLAVTGDNTTADNTTINQNNTHEVRVRQLFATAKTSAVDLKRDLTRGENRTNPHQNSQKSTSSIHKRAMKFSLLTPEQESAVFMSRPSDPNIHASQPPVTPHVVGSKPMLDIKALQTPDGDTQSQQKPKKQGTQWWPAEQPRKQIAKKKFESSHAVVEAVESKRVVAVENMVTADLKTSRQTPLLNYYPTKLDISPVPIAIASKTSIKSIKLASRKNSGKILNNSKSFIDMTNAAQDKVNRIKTLGSGLFNDDLREVAISPAHKVNSHLRLNKDDQSQPRSSTKHIMTDTLTIDAAKEMTLTAPQMNVSPVQLSPRDRGNVSPLQYQQATQIQFPIDRCNWMISNEALTRQPVLGSEGQDTLHILTKASCSNETFHQRNDNKKVQPPRLDQISTRPTTKPIKPQLQHVMDSAPTLTKQKQSASPNRNAYQRRPHYMAAPMIITAKETAKNSNSTKKPVTTKNQKKVQEVYDAPYNKNNSIIIDCNSLVSDTDKEHLLRTNRTNVNHYGSITTNIGKQMGESTPPTEKQMNTEPSILSQQVAKICESKVDPVPKNALPTGQTSSSARNTFLGNPLQTNQLLGPQGKRVQNMIQVVATNKDNSVIKEKDNQNKDIKQLTGKDAGIGVGSVVLHLRKQRVINNASHDGSTDNDDKRIAVQTLNSGEIDVDLMAGMLERDLGTAHLTQSNEQIDGGILLSKKPKQENSDLGVVKSPSKTKDHEAVGSRSSDKRGSIKPTGKNINVLRQKPFTNLVKTVGGTPSVASKKMTSPRNTGMTIKAQGLKKEILPTLELVGTHKEQFMQLPRLPKYDVKYTRKSPRGSMISTARANFFVPHYNYFGNGEQYQQVTPETFGETLQPGQMHQLITLNNGQMMIRRVDMSIEATGDTGQASNMIPIDLANMVQQNGSGVVTASTPNRPNIHMISVQQQQILNDNPGMMQSPTTRLMANHYDSNSGPTPDQLLTPPIMNSSTKRSAPDQQALNKIKRAMKNRDNQSVGVETVCMTDVSDQSSPHMRVDQNYSQQRRKQTLLMAPTISPTKIIPSPMRMEEAEGSASRDSSKSHKEDIVSPFNGKKAPVKKKQSATAANSAMDKEDLTRREKEQLDENQLQVHPLGYPEDMSSENSQSRYSVGSIRINPRVGNTKLSSPENSEPPPAEGQTDSPTLPSHKLTSPFKLDMNLSFQTKFSKTGKLVNSSDSPEKISQQSASSKRIVYYTRGSSSLKKDVFETKNPEAKPLINVKLTTNVIANLVAQNESKKKSLSMVSSEIKTRVSNVGELPDVSTTPCNKAKEKSISLIQDPSDEDPIIRANRFNKKKNPLQSRHSSKNTDLMPWDDKPDICLQQKRNNKGYNKRNILKNNEGSPQKSSILESSIDRKKLVQIAKTSNNSLISSANNSVEKQRIFSPRVTGANSVHPRNVKSPRLLRGKNNGTLVVTDKARESVRETQEREMNAIVFDDSRSPHFRLRNDESEDATLEELVKKPDGAGDMADTSSSADDDVEFKRQETGSEDRQSEEESPLVVKTPDVEAEAGLDGGSPGDDKSPEDQPGLSPDTNDNLQWANAGQHQLRIDVKQVSAGNFFLDDVEHVEEDEDDKFWQEARGAVLMKNSCELKALRSNEIYLKNENSSSEEFMDEEEMKALQATQDAIEKAKRKGKNAKVRLAEDQAQPEAEDEFEGKFAQYGKLLRGKGWKAPMPPGFEGAFVHINDSHLDSYFQEHENK